LIYLKNNLFLNIFTRNNIEARNLEYTWVVSKCVSGDPVILQHIQSNHLQLFISIRCKLHKSINPTKK